MEIEVKYKRAEHIIGSNLEDAMIITSTDNDQFFGMNKVASRIWELLEKPVSKQEVVSILLTQFEVEKEQCEKEVNLFFDEMKKAEIISTIS